MSVRHPEQASSHCNLSLSVHVMSFCVFCLVAESLCDTGSFAQFLNVFYFLFFFAILSKIHVDDDEVVCC